MSYYNGVDFKTLEGKTLKEIRGDTGSDYLVFITEDGDTFEMYHEQDCCESVTIEDICGDLQDLIGTPILLAEESSEDGKDSEWGDTSTWTFYKLRTIKGSVDIRWYGTSNGYYSESVSFVKFTGSYND